VVGVAAGEFGQDAAGLGEADVGAAADGQVAQGLGDERLADPRRYQRVDREKLMFVQLGTLFRSMQRVTARR